MPPSEHRSPARRAPHPHRSEGHGGSQAGAFLGRVLQRPHTPRPWDRAASGSLKWHLVGGVGPHRVPGAFPSARRHELAPSHLQPGPCCPHGGNPGTGMRRDPFPVTSSKAKSQAACTCSRLCPGPAVCPGASGLALLSQLPHCEVSTAIAPLPLCPGAG